MLSVAARYGYELIEHPALVLLRCLSIPVANRPEYLTPRYSADLSDRLAASSISVTFTLRQ